MEDKRDGTWGISGTFAPSLLQKGIDETVKQLETFAEKGITEGRRKRKWQEEEANREGEGYFIHDLFRGTSRKEINHFRNLQSQPGHHRRAGCRDFGQRGARLQNAVFG
jgi:hypothetical protein